MGRSKSKQRNPPLVRSPKIPDGKWPKWAKLVAGIVVGVITASGTLATIWYARKADQLAVLDQRAYLRIGKDAELVFMENPRRFEVAVPIENTGKTSARKVMVQSRVLYVPEDYPSPALTDEHLARNEESTLDPGERLFIRSTLKTDSFTPDKRLRIIGRVTYVDDFGNERFAEFNYRQGRHVAPNSGRFELNLEPTGNRAN